ncbi:MAG: UDP-N-acetylmuramoyl-tripeptide--D-alanyl-D-alanine ligase [Bdellovibrionota bacterium]
MSTSLPWTKEFIAASTNAKVISEVHPGFARIETDTRKLQKGDFFIALKGDAFDAHSFVAQAVEKGAAGVLVHKWEEAWENYRFKTNFYLVKDTLTALQDMAIFHRRHLKTWLAAMTGSNGKTTTKEFSAAILKNFRNVHWSHGSFNNHWGVPFTLLDLKPEHNVGLIEMGMNHSGEIKRLMEIAEPDCVVCTMVGRAHIEHFGSIDKIADAKAEIYENAKKSAVGIFNIENPYTRRMSEIYGPKMAKQITFSSQDKTADIFLQVVGQTLDTIQLRGCILGKLGDRTLNLFGVQNVVNISAAAGIGLAAGLSSDQIWENLKQCKSYWGRNQKIELSSGAQVLFDAYNANPDSMYALLENVKSLTGFKRKIGFFAQMKELGNFSKQEHEKLGEYAAQAGYEQLYFYGPDHESFKTGVGNKKFDGELETHPDFSKDWVNELKGSFTAGDLLTFKASRGMEMERVVQILDPALDFHKE